MKEIIEIILDMSYEFLDTIFEFDEWKEGIGWKE